MILRHEIKAHINKNFKNISLKNIIYNGALYPKYRAVVNLNMWRPESLDMAPEKLAGHWALRAQIPGGGGAER